MVKIKEPDAIKQLIMSDDYEHKRIISISAHIDHQGEECPPCYASL